MGTYISEQLAMFLRSILLGGALGLVYDLLRALRGLGGRFWGGLLDALYCVLAVSSLFFFVMAGDGELRLFVLMGTLGGGVLFFCLLSRPLRPLWDFWLTVLLLPVRLLHSLAKKGLRLCKKAFSFFRKKLTILMSAAVPGLERRERRVIRRWVQNRRPGKRKKNQRPPKSGPTAS